MAPMPAVPIPVDCPVAVPLCGSPPPLRVRFGATADQVSSPVLEESLIAAIIGVPCSRPDQGGRWHVKGSGRRGSGEGVDRGGKWPPRRAEVAPAGLSKDQDGRQIV